MRWHCLPFMHCPLVTKTNECWSIGDPRKATSVGVGIKKVSSCETCQKGHFNVILFITRNNLIWLQLLIDGISIILGTSFNVNTKAPTTIGTSKKSPNVYKSCSKMISLVKLKILTPLQKLPKNVRNLGKLIIANGFEKLPKVQ